MSHRAQTNSSAAKGRELANPFRSLPCASACGDQEELASGVKSSKRHSQKGFDHFRQTSESPSAGQTPCKEVKCLYIDTAASFLGAKHAVCITVEGEDVRVTLSLSNAVFIVWSQ